MHRSPRPAAALLALLLALPGRSLAAPASECGPPRPAGPLPFEPGESVTYDVDLLGFVKGGTLQLSVERPMSGGKVTPLRARAKTDTSFKNLKQVAGVALSWVDARTLVPERYREDVEEDGQRKSTDARLLPPGPEVQLDGRSGDKAWKVRFAREGAALDAVSTAFALRAARLAPGETFCFDLVARGRYWRVRGEVAAKPEKVETPLGKLETLRVDFKARRADQPDGPERPVHVWIGTDARRLLVAAVADVDAGPARAMLASAKGTRKP